MARSAGDDEWQKGMQEMKSRLDKLTGDLQAVSNGIEEAEKPL